MVVKYSETNRCFKEIYLFRQTKDGPPCLFKNDIEVFTSHDGVVPSAYKIQKSPAKLGLFIQLLLLSRHHRY